MTYVANYAVYIVIAGMMVAKGRNEDGQCWRPLGPSSGLSFEWSKNRYSAVVQQSDIENCSPTAGLATIMGSLEGTCWIKIRGRGNWELANACR